MMKHTKIFFSIMYVIVLSASLEAVEYGRHDGSDYCYYMPGAQDGKIYQDNKQKNNALDVYYQNNSNWVKSHKRCTFSGNVNFEELRQHFPIFKQTVNDYPFIYLDSASTAQMPQEVLNEIVHYYDSYKSNAGRGLYNFAEQTTTAVENTRLKVADFIGAKKHEIVFTSGTTGSINLIAHAWADAHIQAGDEIIISEIEHNANFLPWQQLALRNHALLKIAPINEHGVIDVSALQQLLSNKTKLVALVHQSNVLGTTNDVKAVTALAHLVGAKVLVDAAQSIVHQPIDVADIGCDFLAFSGHKLYGPTGVGVLFIKESLFDEIKIPNFGGGMVYQVALEISEFKDIPHGLEAGTQPIAQIIGLGAAIDFIQKNINFKQAADYETNLVKYFIEQLQQIPNITIISGIPRKNDHNNIVTFIADNCHAYDVAEYLNKFGIAVRAGFHCVHLYHEKLGDRASVRVSFSVYNTKEEVDFVIRCLKNLLG